MLLSPSGYIPTSPSGLSSPGSSPQQDPSHPSKPQPSLQHCPEEHGCDEKAKRLRMAQIPLGFVIGLISAQHRANSLCPLGVLWLCCFPAALMTARPCAVNADKPAGQAEGLSDPPEASKSFGAEGTPRYQAEQKPLPPTLTKGMSFPAPRSLAPHEARHP